MASEKLSGVELTAAETGFKRSRYFHKDDPRGPEYGKFRMHQNVSGDYVVAFLTPEGVEGYTMRMQRASFIAWASINT